MGGRGSKTVARSLRRVQERESNGSRRDGDGGRRRGMGSTPPRVVLFIGGTTESIHCGSFHRTKCLNGSILRSLREDEGGFLANQVIATT
jgi:hypothetical protein